jgi:hypothetical protein
MKTFEELFKNAIMYSSIEQPRNEAHRQALEAFYNLKFNNWLAEKKGWQVADKEQYFELLTKENWKEFLTYQKTIANEKIKEFEDEKCRWQIDSPQQTETKTAKLKATVLGLFCGLINRIGIDKKDETESATVFCERICNKFKLPYTDRVRQNYNVKENKRLLKELKEKVLPLIDTETKNLVENYLDKKQPPNQNLYG